MADTLVDDYDVVDLLTGLTDRCVHLLGASAAGVMLSHPYGRLGLVAASSEAMRLLELFELQAQEGPCLDAYHSGERIGHYVLETKSGRWPAFTEAALQAGFQSASAIPLRWRDTTLGALNLLSTSNNPMDEADSYCRPRVRRSRRRQHRASSCECRGSAPERAAVSRAHQPRGHRASQGRALRASRDRPGGGLLADAQLRPRSQSAAHRRRPVRSRRHARAGRLAATGSFLILAVSLRAPDPRAREAFRPAAV